MNYSDAPPLTRTQRKWLIWIAQNANSYFPEQAYEGGALVTIFERGYISGVRIGWTITDAGLEALASYEADENTEEVADLDRV